MAENAQEMTASPENPGVVQLSGRLGGTVLAWRYDMEGRLFAMDVPVTFGDEREEADRG